MSDGKRFYVYDTSIGANDDTVADAKPLFDELVQLLRSSGFKVGVCPETHKRYKSLSPKTRVGRKGDLEVRVECRGRGVDVEFYQNLVIENPHGGRYDFGKLRKMPYLVRIGFLWIRDRIRQHLTAAGYVPRTDCPSYSDDPLGAFNYSWDGECERRLGTHRFRRGPDGWPDDSELNCWRRIDRDGLTISNCESRFVMIGGRAFPCKVYGGINGQWHCVYGRDRSCEKQETAGRLRSIFPGRGRHFDAYDRTRSIQRDLNRAIRDRRFGVADRISRYCEAAGIAISVEQISTVVEAAAQ